MLEEELIQLHISCSTREEAIQLAFQPFVQNHYVTQNYVNDVIGSLDTYGPYIVIAPQIALPHAPTSLDVLKPGIGITVLDTPVYFDSANDPVKYLFPFCSNQNDGHMASLVALSKLFSDDHLFEALDALDTSKQVFDFLKPKGI